MVEIQRIKRQYVQAGMIGINSRTCFPHELAADGSGRDSTGDMTPRKSPDGLHVTVVFVYVNTAGHLVQRVCYVYVDDYQDYISHELFPERAPPPGF
ncbi:hypothetical protein MMC09_005000 [Bachmanniomyces sp. S44760]|nr:hypothetical protein [Bachmanniomyces sp. S44760]